MNLDLVNNIFNNLKENEFVQNFLDELANYLKNEITKNIGSKELPIIENILSKNKLTTGNENYIKENFNNVILDYGKENFRNEAMYFVKDNKKTYWSNNNKQYDDNFYTLLKVKNNKIEEINIRKKDIPQNVETNDVLKIENNKYIIEESATKELQEKIMDMAKEIINKQNDNLDKYRKEGHLYVVSEEIGNNRFLLDITDNSKNEFEEVDIPREILEKAKEGSVLEYTNGKYVYYSNDGFERIEKINNK